MPDGRATPDRAATRFVNDAEGVFYWKRYRCKGCGDINPPTINCPGKRGIEWEALRTMTGQPPDSTWVPALRSEIEGYG